VVRVRLLISIVVVLFLALFAVALAHKLSSPVSVKETPVEAGAPAALSLDTSFASTTGELSALEIDLARGFHFDPRAADTCTEAQAGAGTCPRSSTIGRGRGEIVVQGHYLPRTTYQVGATFYLAPLRHKGDVAGIVLDLYETESQLHATMLGRVVPLAKGRYGLALRFSDTDQELPSGYSLTLLKLSTLMQAKRTSGRTTYNLLTNPSACTGTGWPVQVSLRSSGRTWVYQNSASCKQADGR
jgi:hypothetical protein